MLKFILIVTSMLVFSSCFDGEPYYEKGYYERISGIKFPSSARAIETYDNGEFLTITAFKADSSELLKFIKEYHFTARYSNSPPGFMGAYYLEKNKPECTMNGHQFYKWKDKVKGKTGWIYFVDLDNKKFWAEIDYPDWSGN